MNQEEEIHKTAVEMVRVMRKVDLAKNLLTMRGSPAVLVLIQGIMFALDIDHAEAWAFIERTSELDPTKKPEY